MLPPFIDSYQDESSAIGQVLSGPFRQVMYGPSPINFRENLFLPRLSTAIAFAKITADEKDWKVVERELFYVVDSLDTALCVLDNHLIFPPAIVKDEH